VESVWRTDRYVGWRRRRGEHHWGLKYLDVGKGELPFAQEAAREVQLFEELDGLDNVGLHGLLGINDRVGIGLLLAKKVLGDLSLLGPDDVVIVHDGLQRGLADLEYAPDWMVAVVVGSCGESIVDLVDDDDAEGPVERLELDILLQVSFVILQLLWVPDADCVVVTSHILGNVPE
jgi:hypothetical protein